LHATLPPELSSLSLHDALPIWHPARHGPAHRIIPIDELLDIADAPFTVPECEDRVLGFLPVPLQHAHLVRRHHHACAANALRTRSEEHTSELQSLAYLVCRLLL